MPSMSMTDAGMMGGVLVMGMAALEVAKAAVGKVTARRNGGLGSGVYDQRLNAESLKRIEAELVSTKDAAKGAYRIVSVQDGNGDPRVYYPRDEMKKQTALLEKMNESLLTLATIGRESNR